MCAVTKLIDFFPKWSIRRALKRIFVPVVIEHYPVIAVRVLWETETVEDMHVAETLIASKRMQLHSVAGASTYTWASVLHYCYDFITETGNSITECILLVVYLKEVLRTCACVSYGRVCMCARARVCTCICPSSFFSYVIKHEYSSPRKSA